MRREIIDGHLVHAMFEVINLVDGYDINDKHGKNKTFNLLQNTDFKTELEDHGIFEMKNRKGYATRALNLNGMKALMQYLTSPFAMKFKKHCIHQGTRVDAGDPLLRDVLDANAASSNMYNVMARHQLPHQGASAGPSIAAPPEQVLAVRMVCFCCTYTDIRTTLQVPVAQGAPDVGFKRKAAEDNQIYDWQTDERAYEVQVKQWQRNNDVKTKMLAGAEAAVVKAKGVAESKVILADADVKKKKGNAEAYAIRLDADGKKSVLDAEAEKIKAETALLHFELAQKRKAAGLGSGAKQSETEEKKEERRLALNAKRRESRAQSKAAKNKPPALPQGAA